MRKIMPVAVAIFAVLLSSYGYALDTDTMICRNGIVFRGETMPEAINKCGPPSIADRCLESTLDYDASIVIIVDNWLYNFVPNVFMYSIRFENGRVKKIESLNYGF
jgi:hypothetical protein